MFGRELVLTLNMLGESWFGFGFGLRCCWSLQERTRGLQIGDTVGGDVGGDIINWRESNFN